jgi:transposase
LLACLSALRDKTRAREGQLYPVITIQEAGLDGFWLHRALEMENWITSPVVDAASIAVPHRHRRAKTDRIDGETLVRTLMAWIRGEPRVCSMVGVPTIEDEDRGLQQRRRLSGTQRRRLSGTNSSSISQVQLNAFAQWLSQRPPIDPAIRNTRR